MGGAKRYPSMPVNVAMGIASLHPSYDKRTFAFSRHELPEVCYQLPALLIRGRREDRVLAAPAVSRAICANKTAHEHTGQRKHSGLPCAMALRLTSCSSRRTALLPPSPALLIARFLRVRLAHSASTVSHRTFVTIASVPQLGETGGVMPMICVRTKAEYFCAKGWTGFY
jgi:hypothetical protein